eukprot:3760253-Pyramimonas_sp.AAC.1
MRSQDLSLEGRQGQLRQTNSRTRHGPFIPPGDLWRLRRRPRRPPPPPWKPSQNRASWTTPGSSCAPPHHYLT